MPKSAFWTQRRFTGITLIVGAPFTSRVPSERKRLYRLVPWLILSSTLLRRSSHPVQHVLS